MRRIAALVLAPAAVGALITGCGTGGGGSILDKSEITIGVKADQPGLGLRQGGEFAGFDVDVAKYVAGRLGFPEDKINFVESVSGKREQLLRDGAVDMIVASYSITAARKTQVTFAGPYYVAHQDTLVRSSENGIRNVRDLRDRRLCRIQNSVSWPRVVEERHIPAVPGDAATYSQCVTMLLAGRLDAVSTDDLILAGFAGQHPGAIKIINAPISDEKYGVGLPKGDVDACEAVNTAITQMYQDRTAARLLNTWFGRSGLRVVTSVPQFEGCA